MGEKAAIRPGWYAHPKMANTLGYWDGAKWTDKYAPAVPGSGVKPRSESRPRTWALIGVFLIACAGIFGAISDGYTAAALLAIPGEIFLAVGVIAKGVQVGIWAARG